MKNVILFLLTLISLTSEAATVTTNNVLLYSFYDLSGPTNCTDISSGPICSLEGNHAEVQLMLSSTDTLSGTERLRVSYYENHIYEEAWSVREYTSSELSGSLINDSFYLDVFTGKNQLWADFQGVLLIEAMEGSAAIREVNITVWNNNQFEGRATLTSVPLPAPILLLASGFLALLGLFRR